MATLRQTIAVVDKSGKIVSTSKHLLGVFKEARNAYRERKAEIQAEKQAKIAGKQAKIADMRVRRALTAYDMEDTRSAALSKRSSRSRRDHHRHHAERTTYEDEEFGHPRVIQYEPDLYNDPPRTHDFSLEVGRRHITHNITLRDPPATPSRSKSTGNIDMDLAYGDYHPSLMYQQELNDEEELSGLVAKAKLLLEEADCVHRSAAATMAHLQKDPDAMAAVALTLAEISTLLSKMAPGIVASLKTMAPSVFALLVSPQFLIAAGVGIGVTVVMFGGYKIIKQITSTNQQHSPAPAMDELMELQGEHLSRIETWRRGVADAEASSVGTSVDGEFITPVAAALSRLDLSMPLSSEKPSSEYLDDASKVSHRSRASRHTKASSRLSDRGNESWDREKKSRGKEKEKDKQKKGKKKKRSSRLRLMFTT